MTERERLNLRVPPKAKEAFDNALIDKFGKKTPYGGVELERELRTVLDEGSLAELRETVEEVAEIFGKENREEKTRSLNGSGSALVQYRIAEDVRTRIMNLAENSDYRSAGRFVGDIMMTYALEDGVVGRLKDKLERVKKAAEREVDSTTGPKERRTNTIVEELAGKSQFDLSDFDQAVDEEARGIGSGKHARKEYLPRVLNELGYTWSPTGEEIFVDPSAADIPDTRDPTTKPYHLMDEEDKHLALKFEAYRNAVLLGRKIFTVSDGKETLDGKPARNTVSRFEIPFCSEICAGAMPHTIPRQRLPAHVNTGVSA
ncbi:hypothetical protein [Natrinema salifodinae]|uniref:Uncharacterized protein n=1 Tax=Natrinema salifodinae TaxID=1202768 RepID=A0A1I0N0Y2_9EURY|nr:hypothetical protein [Natrinema salifodinae]SEV94750.1 hypothetical protein SAMN05216285_1230 [Natrinema salifodinae]